VTGTDLDPPNTIHQHSRERGEARAADLGVNGLQVLGLNDLEQIEDAPDRRQAGATRSHQKILNQTRARVAFRSQLFAPALSFAAPGTAVRAAQSVPTL